MDWTVIATTIGLSSIISAVISYCLGLRQKKKERRFDKLTTEKERKYQHMLALMLVTIDPVAIEHIDADIKERAKMLGINSSEYCEKQLEIYMNYMYLYASNSVISAMEKFNSSRNYSTYKTVSREMYKDLWK